MSLLAVGTSSITSSKSNPEDFFLLGRIHFILVGGTPSSFSSSPFELVGAGFGLTRLEGMTHADGSDSIHHGAEVVGDGRSAGHDTMDRGKAPLDATLIHETW